MVAALREAGRVARPGAPVVIQVFGRPERCDFEAVKLVTRPFMPAPSPTRLVGPAREDAVRAKIVEALAPCRGTDGSYRLRNEFHYLVATSP